ncbi:hypothetical protein N480_10610 [Pseudoalteromonas luteoviolacea S2607]|uniref:DUF2971 domain-containing protein n=1 Tax=Pseudoalteromonas luteoviolacea TaxID=43657 RepID=UPI0007B08F7F|nr:DUF2971 domain-containing protein [Pseudoalteromonas luteoviolacea]KZN28536.1 hypothetical protein N480_10610 [Pseudoalteromonas luteoviolacea S2607]
MNKDTEKEAPMKAYLYKFREMNTNSITCLANATLWFSKFDDLNDPFEATFDIDTILDSADINELIKQTKKYAKIFDERKPGSVPDINSRFIGTYMSLGEERFKEQAKKLIKDFANTLLDDMKRSNGVLSMSSDIPMEQFVIEDSNVANLPMWSHYADGLRGFLMCFDEGMLIHSLKELNEGYFASNSVAYDVSPPKLQLSDADNSIIERDSVFQALSSKHETFLNEVERRILTNEYGLKKYSPEALRMLFIGEKMPEDQVELIKLIIKQKYPHTEIFRVHITYGHYAIRLERLK